jgi:predicted permease
MTSSHGRGARALARLLTSLYPRDFRTQFGDDMRVDFLDTLASRKGRGERARFLVAAFIDACRSAAAEHAANRVDSTRHFSRKHIMYGLGEDIRFGARALARRPAFVAAVVLTVALGIGANTAVFSLIDAVFLRPVSVAHPEAVVAVFQAISSKAPNGGTSYPVYRAIRESSRTLQRVAAAMSHSISIKGPAGVETLNAHVVSGNYFSTLGITPGLGRLIIESDDGAHGAAPVIVLSHQVWQRWYAGDPEIVGKTLTIAERPFTIVGVAPATFRGTELADVPDVWAPLSMLTSLGFGGLYAPSMDEELFRTHEFNWLETVARMRPGTTHESIAVELNQIVKRIPHERKIIGIDEPSLENPMSVMPITRSAALRDREALVRFVRLMSGVVLLTLLLACANIANLLLVRSSERAQELGVRAALGAGRARMIRQLFIESAILAISGAAVGLGVAVATIRALSAFTLPGSISLAQLDVSLDARVLAFTGLAAMGTAVLFGLFPAIRASRLDLAGFLRRDRASRSGGTVRNTLVATQIALALALLIGATLFTRSVRAGLSTDLGFDPRPLAAVTVDLRLQGYDKTRALEYYRAVEQRLRAHSEIERFAIASHVPLARMISLPFKAPDATTPDGRKNVKVAINSVSDDYFATIGLPLTRGRLFSQAELKAGDRVVVINEAAAKKFWGAANPLGRSLTVFNAQASVVIGVVPTTKYESVRDEDIPAAYLPLEREFGFGAVSVIARSNAPAAALRAIQQELASIDRNVTLRKPRLVGEQIDEVLMPQRFGLRLFAIFSLIALVVASIGVHGVVAYGVSLRRRELGIRIALGARTAHIYWTVLRGSLIAVALGALVGLGVGALGSPALVAFLYGVRPLDATAFTMATLALATAAVVASLFAARQAVRTDPVTSMRVE